MTQSHYFFALPLPEEVKQTLHEMSGLILNHFPFKQLVHPQDYHITLAFIGAADRQQLFEAVERISTAVHLFRSFPLEISHIGIFGNPEKPRILWSGVDFSESLMALQRLTATSCSDAGFKMEKRPFSPHVTLAKRWNGEHSFAAANLEEMTSSFFPMPAFMVNEAVLYQIHPTRVPKYERIHTFTLLP